ncbi:MAG: 50S ribosomal protein L11 methyltransferase [Pseudomonadota bacterium]
MSDESVPGFQRAPAGIAVPPCWRVLRPGEQGVDGERSLYIRPGKSFGDGRHPSTQLCLQAIATYAPRDGRAWQVLDVGTGSGILAIAAAHLGARVDAVDCEGAACQEALINLGLNGVQQRVRLAGQLAPRPGCYDLVLANILRPVLLELAPTLAASVAPGGDLVLSGLVATDVPELNARYAPLLAGKAAQVFALGEWRALVWRGPSALGATTTRA